MEYEGKQNAPEFSGRVKAVTQMDAILRDVQANEKRVKKARAEVLAACVHHVRKRAAQLDNITANILADELLIDLQPAAKDLEELLLEAELKGRLCILRENPSLCNGDTDNPERHARLCKYHQEIAELEKARVSEKNG